MTALATEEDIYLRRELPGGALIEFEERTTGFRAYWYTPPNGKRVRLPSVTTIIGAVTPKQALLEWYEDRGAESALILARGGFLDHIDPVNAGAAVREAKIGAKRTLGDASGRGKRIHAVLEAYLKTGFVPNPSDYPETDRGYLRALIRWLLKTDPEPEDTERLVCDPERGYAGRLDVRARIHGMSDSFIIDAKTNRRAAIYPEALLQVAGYHQADVKCGAAPALGCLLVALGPDGEFSEGYAPLEAWDAWDRALDFYHALNGMGQPLEVH